MFKVTSLHSYETSYGRQNKVKWKQECFCTEVSYCYRSISGYSQCWRIHFYF